MDFYFLNEYHKDFNDIISHYEFMYLDCMFECLS